MGTNTRTAVASSKANIIVAFALALSLVSSGSMMGVEMLQVARRICRQLSLVSDLAQQSSFVICFEKPQAAVGGHQVR